MLPSVACASYSSISGSAAHGTCCATFSRTGTATSALPARSCSRPSVICRFGLVAINGVFWIAVRCSMALARADAADVPGGVCAAPSAHAEYTSAEHVVRLDVVLVELERLLRRRNRFGHPVLARMVAGDFRGELRRRRVELARALERGQRAGVIACRLHPPRHQEFEQRLRLRIDRRGRRFARARACGGAAARQRDEHGAKRDRTSSLRS